MSAFPDPATPATSKWPAGNYALPMTEEGCPSDVFSEGTRIQTGAGELFSQESHRHRDVTIRVWPKVS